MKYLIHTVRAVLTRRTATTTTAKTTTTIAEHLSQQVLRNLRNKRTFTRVTMLTSSLLWLYAGCWNRWLHDTRWSVCGCVSSLSLFSCILFRFVSFWVMRRVRIVLPHGTFIALKTSIHCIVHHVPCCLWLHRTNSIHSMHLHAIAMIK